MIKMVSTQGKGAKAKTGIPTRPYIYAYNFSKEIGFLDNSDFL